MSAAWVTVATFGHAAGETDFDRYLEREMMFAWHDPVDALRMILRERAAWARVRVAREAA